ncbi:acyltransferase family protein [Geodermatophilus dictyosporus]|uniref:acyltransferase family protein n=1 Tax=Geodermatophilus dictyosporus TaxID=1523247 RepID=UPI00145C290D|nr:acyltransferase [Geodermatophilus dictyosporus]
METLAQAFDPRRNSLAVLRLGFAAVVAVAHALAVGFGWQPHLGATALGDLAVDGFFVLSGFLVTRSFLRLEAPGRFVWHRFLRIMPGFWVCLVVTALVVAPLAAVLVGRTPGSVFTAGEDPAWRYVVVNAALPVLQYEIAGIAADDGESVFDGSLWTLQYEAFCYGVVWVLGVTAVLRRERGVVLAVCVAVWAGTLLEHAGLIPFDVPLLANDQLLRFLLVFLLGAAGFLFADVVPVRASWAVMSAVVVLAGAFLPDHRVVGALSFAYLCVYGMVRLPLRWTPSWDLSYGLYVYHWPVQLLLLLAGGTALGSVAYVLVSLGAALVLAALSWVAVEGPALRLKDARPPALRPGGRRRGGPDLLV